MKKRKFTIGKKILTGFLGLIIAFVIYVVYSVLTINYNNTLTIESTNVITPSVEYLKEFQTLVIRSRMLITNWVYLPRNEDDKNELRAIYNGEYDALKTNLNEKIALWEDSLERTEMQEIFKEFEALMDIQEQDIMNSLRTFDDYEDPSLKFMAEETIESSILPTSATINSRLEKIIDQKNKAAVEAQLNVVKSSQNLKNMTIFLGVTLSILGVIVALIMARSITRPVNFLRSLINKLALGELAENQHKKFAGDEIGEMAEAVDKLVAGLRSASLFAENISTGKYDTDYKPLSDKDVLGNALLEMRNNLQKVAEEDKKRNWATEGLAKFGEILRKNNDNIEKLSDEIISNLIKYLRANQGGLYIVNDDDENDKYLYLAACYAWDKKKYLEQKVYIGEGLTGQAWIEKDSIYLTDVPENYITITSGLGEANPRCILITPLKVNDEVYGVIEIASFNQFASHEIEFVEKIAESIASTISSVKINQTTQRLLEESTEMTEQMRAQEEEMRQNMEELQATQEEMQRASKEREARERIIVHSHMMFDLDPEFKIVQANQKAAIDLNYRQSELTGKSLAQLIESKEAFNSLKNALVNSETWSGILRFVSKTGETVVGKVSAGRQDHSGTSSKYLLFALDITNVAS